MEALLHRILEKLDSLETGQKSLEAGMERLEARQTALEAGMERLEARQKAFEAGMERLEARQTALEAGMERLEVMQTALASGQQELHAVASAIRNRQEETDAKLEALAMDVHKIHGIVTNHNEKLDRLTNEFFDFQDEIRAELRGLKRHVRSIEGELDLNFTRSERLEQQKQL